MSKVFQSDLPESGQRRAIYEQRPKLEPSNVVSGDLLPPSPPAGKAPPAAIRPGSPAPTMGPGTGGGCDRAARQDRRRRR